MITWALIAAITFLTFSLNMYNEEVIKPTKDEQENEKRESEKREDIDTLIENALRADSTQIN